MKVVLDENLPPSLARALHELSLPDEHTVRHATELVTRGTSDVELFRALSEQAYTVHVTKDHHHRKPVERKAITECGLVVFVLAKGWSDHKYWDIAAQLVRWWPLMVDYAAQTSPPAVFRVPWKLGKFEVIRI